MEIHTMNAVRRVVSKVREVGPMYTLQLFVEHHVPRWLFDIRVVYLCERCVADGGFGSSDPDIRQAAPTEVDELIAGHPVITTMREKLGPGAQLWLLPGGDGVDAFMWLDTDVLKPSHWIRFELAPDDIAGVFLWVSPDRRGQGLGPRMNRHVANEVAEAGFRRIVSTVDVLNRNSLRADEKVGYRRIGRLFAMRVLGIGLVVGRRMVRFGVWSGARPLSLTVGAVERSVQRAA
jgi:GNAT superfamily N-acetyltransferase